jgi:hypothetical protein
VLKFKRKFRRQKVNSKQSEQRNVLERPSRVSAVLNSKQPEQRYVLERRISRASDAFNVGAWQNHDSASGHLEGITLKFLILNSDFSFGAYDLIFCESYQARSHNREKRVSTSSCPSLRPHV